MGSAIRAEIRGLDELQRKLGPGLIAAPARRFFERASILVENRGKALVPVDTGRLRSSLAHEIDSRPVPLWAKVGTNVEYAIDVETGAPPHVPNLAAIEAWARRHGMPGAGPAIAAKIARVGTKARPYLFPALEDNETAIRALVAVLAQEIEAEGSQ